MTEQDLRIGWIGFHQEGIPALRSLLDSGIQLEAVITLDEESLARRSASAGYENLLAGRSVSLHKVQNINDDSSIRLLRSLNLDLLFVIGWSQILSPAVLSTASVGVIGAHASLLPWNRGCAPINWSLIRGETTTGNTLIWLSENVDEGRIIDQMEFEISPYDTCDTLYQKVAATNQQMIQRLLPDLFAGKRPGSAQPHIEQPLLPRRRPSDGLVSWNEPAVNVYNFVRALTRPYPGAFSFIEGKRWIVQSCALLPSFFAIVSLPGTILGPVVSPVEEACGLAVSCGSGAVVILELESVDGKILKGQELSDLEWTGKVWANE